MVLDLLFHFSQVMMVYLSFLLFLSFFFADTLQRFERTLLLLSDLD